MLGYADFGAAVTRRSRWQVGARLASLSVSGLARIISLAAFVLMAMLANALHVGGAEASNLSSAPTQRLTPIPVSQNYRIHVFGDSLARGLWHGLNTAIGRKSGISVERRAKSATGLVRRDRYDWFTEIDRFTSDERFEIAIVLIGGNDRQDIRQGSKRFKRFSPAWVETYRARVDHFMKTFARRGIPVYWVGLPVVRSDTMTRDYAVMNQIYRERAAVNGVRFIDVWNEFRGSHGGYEAYGPDIKGRTVQIRDGDGLHFSTPGNLVFAHLVAPYILGDIARANGEHKLPTAGLRP